MQTAHWHKTDLCHRGIILNDDCFYISFRFLCVSLTMPLWVLFFFYPSLCCFFSFHFHQDFPRRRLTLIHTHVPPTAPSVSSICLLWFLKPVDFTNRGSVFGCVLFPLQLILWSSEHRGFLVARDSFEEYHRALSLRQNTNVLLVHLPSLLSI